MIFVLVFSALAVSMATLSGTNVQLAENLRKANRARACAESGFEVIRFWLSHVAISGTTAPSERFSRIASSLQGELTANSITNVTTSYSSSLIGIPTVTLDSASASSFFAAIRPLDAETLQIDVTGVYGPMPKTIRVNYKLSERANNVFDFGVATKGPLFLTGNMAMTGVNLSVEASVYIESLNSNLALSIIGNSQIAGDVSIVNPIANAFLQGGKAGIGGETGQAAVDNHVSFGVPPTEFPEPNPGPFASYVTSVIDANTNTSLDATFENVRILANINPKFTGHPTLKGVVFIDTPNVVEFAGGANVTAIIAGNGSVEDNSGTNRIIFRGNVDSHPVSDLPNEARFAGLRDQTGTFLIAPGFHVSFGGTFSSLSGAIAGNGVEFFGNAGGTIRGSVINYSDAPMPVSGNSDLYFNRSGLTEVPAGFVPEIVLKYNPASYSEVAL